jgi:phosphatidylserine/phosphatidylglycerophosphate/cardiolipin synthase-like enzyme
MKTFKNMLMVAIGLICTLAMSLEIPKAPAGVYAGRCNVQVAFSPRGGAADLVLATINNARTTIRMATYSFTDPVYARALLNAKRRGVDVAIVSDEEHNGRRRSGSPSVVEFLRENDLRVAVTSAYAIQHNKFIVADENTVQTGSLNYSRAAEKSNAENVLVVSSCPHLAQSYTAYWNTLWNSAADKSR